MADARYIIDGRPKRSYDQWLAAKTGLREGFSCQELEVWQKEKLSRQAAYAVANSRFYREKYHGFDLNDPFSLPFTTEEELRNKGSFFACMPGSDIQRVVSMYTSGSTGAPKRLFFSAEDLELTVDFFAQGMLNMTGPGKKVMIFMGNATPDGLSDLLARGLRRIDVLPLIYEELRDPVAAAHVMEEFVPHCVVGLPRQMLSLAELTPHLRPETVLLSADNIPDTLRSRVEWLWQTEVFAHWGMRETGLGGAVECHAHQGQHIRHADLLLEIIDPDTGHRLPYGQPGEIVISTLTRTAQPLLRYRTGDYSRLMISLCGCGSALPRLDKVSGHKDKILAMENA